MDKVVCYIILILSISGGLSCQEDSTNIIKKYNHSLQMGTIDWVFGTARMNYEWLMQQKHGIVVEGRLPLLSKNTGYAFNVQYRKHKTPGMKAGYWGIFVNYIHDEGTLEIKEDDETKKYGYKAKTITAGAYFGKKWVWNHGISLAYRLGYGIPFSDFKWKNDVPKQRRLIEAFYKIFSGIDTEFTVGICF